MEYFARAELIRKKNLWPAYYRKKEEVKPPPVPLMATFEKPQKFVARDWTIQSTSGGKAFESIDKVKRILEPHEVYRQALEEMTMLFLGIDLAGEKRRADLREHYRVENVKREEDKKKSDAPLTNTEIMLEITDPNSKTNTASKGGKPGTSSLFQMAGVVEAAQPAVKGTGGSDGEETEYAEWKEPLDEDEDDRFASKKTKNHGSIEKSSSKKAKKKTSPSYHSVLHFSRQRLKQHRNARQKTHEIKRVVLSELTRKVYADKRLWFHRWELQEKLLEEAVQTFVAEAKERARLTKDKEYREQKEREAREEDRMRERLEEEKRANLLNRPRSHQKQRSLTLGGEEEEEEEHVEELTVFEKLANAMDTKLPLPKSFHSMEFYHKLIKYKRTNSFSRPTWVKWRANIERLKDLYERKRELENERERLEYTFRCPVEFKHTTVAHCKRCDWRILKGEIMWYTNINNPNTKVVALLTRDYSMHYVEVKHDECVRNIKKLETENAWTQLGLFEGCGQFLQQTYAIHRIYMTRSKIEKKCLESIERYKARRLERMKATVQDGRLDVDSLYVRYADIEDEVKSFLHEYAVLRRHKVKIAGKRIIRIWR